MPDAYAGGFVRDETGALVVVGKDGAGLGSDNVLTFELADDTTLSSPSAEGGVILSGTFTPDVADVPISVNCSPVCEDAGQTQMGLSLRVGRSNLTRPFYPTAFGAAVPAGVQDFLIGPGVGHRPVLSGRVLATGLTPGEEYAFEVLPTIVGGYYEYPTSSSPTTIAINRTRLPYPDGGFVGVVTCIPSPFGTSNNKVEIWRHDHQGRVLGEVIKGSVAIPDAIFTGEIAITPNGKYAILTNALSHKVYVIDTGAPTTLGGAWTAPGITGYTVPGTTPAPVDVACASNTEAWIAAGTAQRLIRLRLSDGDMTGPSYLLSTALSKVVTDGTSAYVNDTSRQIRKVRLSDGVVQSTYTAEASAVLLSMALTPSGSHLYALKRAGAGGNQVFRFATSSLTSPVNTYSVSAFTTPGDIAVHDDDRSFWVTETGAGTYAHVRQYQIPGGVVYHTDGSAANKPVYSVALLPTGAIAWPDNLDNTLNLWPGGSFSVFPDQVLYQSSLEVIVEKAT